MCDRRTEKAGDLGALGPVIEIREIRESLSLSIYIFFFCQMNIIHNIL